MRIIETFSTILDRNNPGRQFTLHLNEYELADILSAMDDDEAVLDIRDQIENALD